MGELVAQGGRLEMSYSGTKGCVRSWMEGTKVDYKLLIHWFPEAVELWAGNSIHITAERSWFNMLQYIVVQKARRSVVFWHVLFLFMLVLVILVSQELKSFTHCCLVVRLKTLSQSKWQNFAWSLQLIKNLFLFVKRHSITKKYS